MGISSLFTGSSALGAFSNELDVIGNNLANLDTSGFKSQSVGFQDLLYQTLQAGTAQSGNVGSVNPQQVGFGVQLGATGTDFTQGTATATGNPLNASIQGNGFFVVNNGTQDFYTRAGDFSVDSAGILIDSNTGDAVQRFGSVGQGTATLPAFQTPGNLDITIPYGQTVPGTPTANVTLQGNISADQSVGGTTNASIQVYDTQGTTRAMTVTFTETAANTYSVSATIDGGTVTFPGGNTVTFDPTTGLLQSPSTLSAQLNGLPGAQTININLGSIGASNGITQFGSTSSSVSATAQDGTGPGTLSSVSIDSTGTLEGVFSNGLSIPIAQLALASFANPSGLERSGNNYFTASAAAGNPIIGPASTGSLGSVQGGTLEGSNVDISTEFTQLIIAQNAYSVNSRTITVADQVLQDTTALIPQ
jgi:flagellar hook protein FlgE